MPHINLSNISLDIPLITPDRISLRKELLSNRIGGTFVKKKKSQRADHVKVLIDINYKFKAGDRVALIGPNGAGKSTLLRLLAGVYPPSSGNLEINGKICSLLDVNVGMNTELSGYNNLISIAYHFGMKKKEIYEKINKMVKFTDLGNFINLPVRSYSSGMVVRLGYSVIQFLDPEILLLDESIGAGDLTFTNKATSESKKILNKANIIIMASHDIELLQKFCNKAIFLSQGKIIYHGSVIDCFEKYRMTFDPSANQ